MPISRSTSSMLSARMIVELRLSRPRRISLCNIGVTLHKVLVCMLLTTSIKDLLGSHLDKTIEILRRIHRRKPFHMRLISSTSLGNFLFSMFDQLSKLRSNGRVSDSSGVLKRFEVLG